MNLPKSLLGSDLYSSLGYDVNDFESISVLSQKKILEWITVELNKHPDILMIYRPHPAEHQNDELVKLSEKHKNFVLIEDYSIKQWIVVVDKIYTWWSTSVAEVYMAGKSCSILRPIKIPFDSEIEYYNNANTIDNFIEFDESYLEDSEFPIAESDISKFYYIDKGEPAFFKVVDYLETVLDDNTISVKWNKYNKNNSCLFRIYYNFIMKIKVFVFEHDFTKKVLKGVCNRGIKIFGRTYEVVEDEYYYEKKMYERNKLDMREVAKKYKRIKRLIGRVYH